MMGAEDKEESGEGQVDSVGDQDDSKNNDNNVDEMDMDEARPEATLTYKVENFTSLKETAMSPPTMVRNLPWKIMIMPRNNNENGRKSMGFFLQCNGESEASSWSCQASAELKIIHVKKPEDSFVRKISHLFFAKENDWGFSHFLAWNEVCDAERGFLNPKDDSVTFEVKVTADAPHGVSWDSKKHTGFVGLRNQGATCYMNSLLQVLYFTNILRKCVYKMPTEADDNAKSVGLALQRVFYDLQFLDKAVGTKKLTKSFGWETLDSFMQHDVQEFLRVLLDKLEVKMKGTCVAGIIPKLFEGKTLSYIRCKNVDYESSRTETFYDIQLNIKGQKTIMDSFKDYIKTENLDGDNKYDAGNHGLQDAEKGILFKKLPPILHLHLMRFQYDPVTDSSVKFNDRFEFTDSLDLSEFINNNGNATGGEDEDLREGSDIQGVEAMEVDSEDPVRGSGNDLGLYVLHAVLVHSGDNHGGHYVVFINPNCDGKWCKFDDDVVSRCTVREAIQNNFGGSDNDDMATKQSSNAYMLVYVRKSALKEVLTPVGESDIPTELVDRLQEEKKIEVVRRKEKSEAHLYMNLKVMFEDCFHGHQGNDLYDTERVNANFSQEVRVRRQDTLRDVMTLLSEQLKYPRDQMRLWPMVHRTNQTLRPSLIDMEGDIDKAIIELTENAAVMTVFLEVMDPGSTPSTIRMTAVDSRLEDKESEGSPLRPTPALPSFDKDQDVLLFFKYYDPAKEKIYYMGHSYVSIQTKVSNLVPMLVKRANLPEGSQLSLFEEIKPNMIERMEEMDKPLEHVLEELMDGDIIVFQLRPAAGSAAGQAADGGHRLPTCRDYFRDLFFRIDVNFVDKNSPNDAGFILTLSQKDKYEQMVEAVAKHLEVEKTHLQFFKNSNYRDQAGQPLKCTYEGTLKELFIYFKPRNPRKIFYQRLAIPIHELENKKQFKATWMSADQKEEKELILYPNKNGRVDQLLEEARQHVTLEANGSGQLRLLEIVSHKVHCINLPEAMIENLNVGVQSKTYRIEETPLDQVNLADDEMIVPVAHFHREAYTAFGTPFLIKIKEGETCEAVKERIRSHLDVPEKEFEKYRMALVQNNRAHFFDEEPGGGGGGGGAAPPASPESSSPPQLIKLSQFQSTQTFTQGGGAGHNVASSGQNNLQYPHPTRPFIGLQHANKANKRARYNYMEKAIKIYN